MSLCDDSGLYSRKHPVMPLSSRYSIPGFWTRDSLYLHHVDSVASSFSILVTFAIVLEVRGISFFQIPWTILGRSSLNQKIATRVLLTSSRFYAVTLLVLPSPHGLTESNMLNSFGILIHASTTQKKNICSFGLSLFSYFLALVYQLIVRSNCAFVLSMPIILVVCQAILIRND